MDCSNFAIKQTRNYTIAMKRNLTLLLLLGSAALFAQTNIKLEGTLFDQKTNQPLSEKTFVVEGLNIQAKQTIKVTTKFLFQMIRINWILK